MSMMILQMGSLSLSSQFNLFRHTKLLKPLKLCPMRRIVLVANASSQEPNSSLYPLTKAAVFLVGSLALAGFIIQRPRLSFPTPAQVQSEREAMFEKLLEEDSTNVEALKVVLHDKMRKGKTKEAVHCFEKLIEAEPLEVEWRLLQALCYETMGQLSTAKRLLREILEERPLLLRALHGLAMVMHKNNEGPAIFEMLDKALELARREIRVAEERNIKILIAQMHVVKGDLEGGLKRFQELVREDPRDFRPYLCQGIIFSLMDKKREAQEQFEIYQTLVPGEFPQRGFLDDVVLEAKSKSREQFQKEFVQSSQKRSESPP